MRNRRQRAFTLVELLVVIGILLVLSTLAFAVFNVHTGGERMRSGARLTQSAFLGARDRAAHAKDFRGLRFIRDLTDPTLVTGFVYLQPLATETAGNVSGQFAQNNVSVTRPGLPANSDATGVVISGSQGLAWFKQDQNGLWPASGVTIRIPAQTGTWYSLARQSASAPYWGTLDSSGNLNLTLQTPYVGGKPWPANTNAVDPADSNASCEIQLGNDVLPFHQPIALPSGVVIDLAHSSPNVAAFVSATANFDIMFSPRGAVAGTLAGLGPLHFLIRDIRDATAGIDPSNLAQSQTAKGDALFLALYPQTGLVQTFELDPTDANGDGIADNIFNLAQQGRSAGR